MLALPRRWPTYTVTPSDLSRLRSTVSSDPLRTLTLMAAAFRRFSPGIGGAELLGVGQGGIHQALEIVTGVAEAPVGQGGGGGGSRGAHIGGYDTCSHRFLSRAALFCPHTMSRKPKRCYFVRGQFVAEGSELDLEFKRELKGTSDATRTDLETRQHRAAEARRRPALPCAPT